MGFLQKSHRSRRANGTAANDCVQEFKRLTFIIQEELRRSFPWRRLAAVQRRQLAAFCMVINQEGTAAETGTLRFDKAQHGLHRHHRIYGVSARCDHLASRLSRERIGRGDHEAL